MQPDWERSNVLFHSRAGAAVNNLFFEFKACTESIDRRRDENVFQQQLGIFSTRLKNSLDNIALEMLEQIHPGSNHPEWNHSLSVFIQQYVQAFRQKAEVS